MKYLILIFIAFCIFGCTKQKVLYVKYIYNVPSSTLPHKAVTDIEIWISRLINRRLYKLSKAGFLEKDLLREIENKNNLEFTIHILRGEKFSDQSEITAKDFVESVNFMKSHINNSIYKNIQSITSYSKYSVKVKLKRENIFFKKLLASHFFPILKVGSPLISSGLYKRTDLPLEFKIRINDSKYPKRIKLATLPQKLKSIKSKNFDTALASPIDLKLNTEKLKFSIFETWGFVLNLKGRFQSSHSRACFNQSFNRDIIVKEILKNHEAIPSFKYASRSCPNSLKEVTDTLIPIEIGEQGKMLCKLIKKSSNANCIFIPFTELLERIKNSNFEAAFLSLTIDLPYIESIGNYLTKNEQFSILNTDIPLPLDLGHLTGIKYINKLFSFLRENSYFIALTRPSRIIYGSNLKNYTPSLIGTAYDSLENLER
jgi:hypothetical protein